MLAMDLAQSVVLENSFGDVKITYISFSLTGKVNGEKHIQCNFLLLIQRGFLLQYFSFLEKLLQRTLTKENLTCKFPQNLNLETLDHTSFFVLTFSMLFSGITGDLCTKIHVFSIKVCYADKEETFSQNYRMADVGKDLCRSSCPSPLLKERSTRTGTQDFIQLHFENLKPFRQPVPVITLTVKQLLGKTDFKLNAFVCRTWLNLSATTVSPSSFIRYKDGYSEHTSGFIVFRNSEITKSYHTLRGKLTKQKKRGSHCQIQF